ncbi:hypothetical protein AYI70_g1183 [Smittium culicis]|uniref:Uncharacterized protein n=1 Tax=Smittium culicis TaxID=133412 RepID=A0A1R1YDM6_9FUNG|nr:hypothetical protein AYI70_g1183 [Smittium culicis]
MDSFMLIKSRDFEKPGVDIKDISFQRNFIQKVKRKEVFGSAIISGLHIMLKWINLSAKRSISRRKRLIDS